MERLTETQGKALRLAFFIIGIALPLVGWKLWTNRKGQQRLSRIDEAHDTTVEDSFPASDPPSSW